MSSLVRTSLLLLGPLALLSAAGCDPEPESEADATAECTLEDGLDGCDADGLQEALDGLGGKEDGWLTYESGYSNLILVGQTAEGLDVVAIIGTHSADYPYVGSDPWDNVLLMVGDQQLTRTDARIPGLMIEGFGEDDARGQVTLVDDLYDAEGTPVAVDLSWELSLASGGARFLGLWPLGLSWAPSLLTPTQAEVELTVDEQDHRLAGLHGLSEVGALKNLKDDDFAVQYDALFVLPRPTEAHSFAYAEISTRTLPSSDMASVLDPMLDAKAGVQDTYEGHGASEGNQYGVVVPSPQDESVVLFEDVVDSGLAAVRRQVVQVRDGAGRPLLGLRDVFEAY